jgi:hypothetical protein
MLDALRAEFPGQDAAPDQAARYGESWARLKAAVKPSFMADMR